MVLKLAAEEFPDAAEENLKGALELSEQEFRKSEKKLIAALVASTLLAILILILLPTRQMGTAVSLVLVALVFALAFIGNTVNIAALAFNKESFDKG